VVVTGLGIVSPIGVGLRENWAAILAGKSGIVSLKGDKEFEGLKSQIGGRLPPHFKIDDYKTSVRLSKTYNYFSLLMQGSLAWQMQ
jgi:3-oxoacyl-[acyl-carrier-protein] synthase II